MRLSRDFFLTSPKVFSALLDLVLCLFKLLKLEKVRKNKYNNQRKMMIFAHTQRKASSLSLNQKETNDQHLKQTNIIKQKDKRDLFIHSK